MNRPDQIKASLVLAFLMDGISLDQRRSKIQFLATLAETGNATAAARAAGISRSTAYTWRQLDGDFAASWDHAIAEAVDRLAMEAWHRALNGVEHVRYFKGEPVGTFRQYSDHLLMFLLRAHRPDLYRNLLKTNKTDTASVQKAREDISRKLENLAAQIERRAAPKTDPGDDPAAG